jgi:hypothetical protein
MNQKECTFDFIVLTSFLLSCGVPKIVTQEEGGRREEGGGRREGLGRRKKEGIPE